MSGDLRLSEGLLFLKEDLIGMPPIGSFDTRDEFYGTWAHEIIHSTGHPYRLGRFDDLQEAGGVLCLRRTSGGTGKLHLVR